jgi:hypothetical protein
MKPTLGIKVALGFCLTMIATAFIVIALALLPAKPIKVLNSQIVSSTVKPNGIAQYNVQYCKYTKHTSLVFRELVPINGGGAITIPVTLGDLEPGCHKSAVFVPIPAYTPAGTYQIESFLVYQVNLFKQVTYDYTVDGYLTIN